MTRDCSARGRCLISLMTAVAVIIELSPEIEFRQGLIARVVHSKMNSGGGMEGNRTAPLFFQRRHELCGGQHRHLARHGFWEMPEVAGDQRDARRPGTFQKWHVVRVRQFPRSLSGGGFN